MWVDQLHVLCLLVFERVHHSHVHITWPMFPILLPQDQLRGMQRELDRRDERIRKLELQLRGAYRCGCWPAADLSGFHPRGFARSACGCAAGAAP